MQATNYRTPVQQSPIARKLANSAFLLAVSTFLTPVAWGNVVGTATQNFNATASSQDFVTVYSSKTIGKGRIGLGIFLNNAVNSLPYFEDGEETSEPASRSTYSDSVLAAEAHAAYGVLRNLDVFIGAPAVLHQDVSEDEELHGEFERRGITEFRGGVKANVYSRGPLGAAVVASGNYGATNNDPYRGKESNTAYNLELVGDLTFSKWAFAVNLGHRWINPGKKVTDPSPIEPRGNQFIYSAAAGYSVTRKARLVGEVFSSAPTSGFKDDSGRHSTTAEALAGMKYFATKTITYNAGAGTEMRHSVSSPDWRVYGGVHWVFGRSNQPSPAPINRFTTRSGSDNNPQVFVMQDVLFHFNSDKLRDSSVKHIRLLANQIKRTEDFDKLVIEGHTCALGAATYNKNLSQKRADAIRRMLITRYDIAATKVTAVGYGESVPAANNKLEEGRELNRRVEFKVYKKKRIRRAK